MVATEKIYKLMWEIKENYNGIIPKEGINAVNSILLDTIKSIKEEEKPWSFEEAQDKYYSDSPEGMFYGMDRNGNKGYFEDFEQSIGE